MPKEPHKEAVLDILRYAGFSQVIDESLAQNIDGREFIKRVKRFNRVFNNRKINNK